MFHLEKIDCRCQKLTGLLLPASEINPPLFMKSIKKSKHPEPRLPSLASSRLVYNKVFWPLGAICLQSNLHERTQIILGGHSLRLLCGKKSISLACQREIGWQPGALGCSFSVPSYHYFSSPSKACQTRCQTWLRRIEHAVPLVSRLFHGFNSTHSFRVCQVRVCVCKGEGQFIL